MTTIAVVMATALLVAVAAAMAVSAMVSEHRDGRLEARRMPRASVLALFVAAFAVAALASAAFWSGTGAAEALAEWSEAALPAWLAWLV